ncbi:MAG TPA: hypothetical protein PLQ93_13315 [Bacteroidia bacterium]|nr:hypothetical protein [Bacteroidia bacterium]
MKTLKSKFILTIALLQLTNLIKSQEDPGNNGCLECPTTNSKPCLPNATSWVLGGNHILASTPGGFGAPGVSAASDVGTCNEYPFILKANNKNSLFIQPNTYVGVGYLNSSPAAALDIRDGNSPAPSNFRIYANTLGQVESTTDMRLHFANGQNFQINEGSVNNSINRLYLQNGKMGLNNSNPTFNLDISDAGSAEARIKSLSNAETGIWISNNSESYRFFVDHAGTGHVCSGFSSPKNLINFSYNSISSKPQVWIGKRPTTGNHTDFSMAVEGKLLANSVYVTLQGNWADFVFEKNYALASLSEVESFYTAHHHLPGIPSAQEVKETGFSVEEINTLLLKKIEELTLYLVQQEKEINALKTKK